MAADVLTFNAIQEVNEELRAQIAEVHASIVANGGYAGGGGGPTAEGTELQRKVRYGFKQNPVYFGCMIPKNPTGEGAQDFDSGLKVCDDTGYYRCGRNCTWTVPSGVTCARFQIWGPGSSSGSGCCCGVGMPGTSGAYASVIIPVTAGDSYILCAGCAYCCYGCFSNIQPGTPSYVQGNNLSNYCVKGGDNCWCRMVKDYGQCAGLECLYTSCMYQTFFSLCPTNVNDMCLCDGIPSNSHGRGGQYDNNRNQCPMIANKCVGWYGSATDTTVNGNDGSADIYAYCGMYSQYFRRQSGGWGIKYPPVYGFLGCWDDYERCCTEACCFYQSGCCRQAQNGYRQVPSGPGAISLKCGGHTNDPFGDSGRMGMVCVSWKS
tara:strand:- start:809 stop:1939 length:1131 start_codon:yes stop_codon:yes gene_type:complete